MTWSMAVYIVHVDTRTYIVQIVVIQYFFTTKQKSIFLNTN